MILNGRDKEKKGIKKKVVRERKASFFFCDIYNYDKDEDHVARDLPRSGNST